MQQFTLGSLLSVTAALSTSEAADFFVGLCSLRVEARLSRFWATARPLWVRLARFGRDFDVKRDVW